jgi:hypothetical protein
MRDKQRNGRPVSVALPDLHFSLQGAVYPLRFSAFRGSGHEALAHHALHPLPCAAASRAPVAALGTRSAARTVERATSRHAASITIAPSSEEDIGCWCSGGNRDSPARTKHERRAKWEDHAGMRRKAPSKRQAEFLSGIGIAGLRWLVTSPQCARQTRGQRRAAGASAAKPFLIEINGSRSHRTLR